MSSTTFVQHLLLPCPLWHSWAMVRHSTICCAATDAARHQWDACLFTVIESSNPSVVTSISTTSAVYHSLYTNWFRVKGVSKLPCLVHTLYYTCLFLAGFFFTTMTGMWRSDDFNVLCTSMVHMSPASNSIFFFRPFIFLTIALLTWAATLSLAWLTSSRVFFV